MVKINLISNTKKQTMTNFKSKSILSAVAAVLVAGTATFTSCNKDDDFQSGNNNFQYETKSLKENVSTKQIAHELAEAIRMKPEIANEIHSAVATVVDYGLDENITFYDVLNTEKSVFLKSEAGISNLRSAINVSTLQSLGFNADNYYGNLNIYWGYHNKWDKSTSPTICYLDDNHTSKIVKGFSTANGDMQEVEITEEYFDSAAEPIIIINYNETDYSKYPNFKNGERTKDGIKWLKPTPVPGTLVEWIPNPVDNVYEAYCHKFVSSGIQHDYFWAGGSEFEIRVIYATAVGEKEEVFCAFQVSRDEIEDRTPINIEFPIHEDWQPECGKVHIYLSEDDAGLFIDPIDINLEFGGSSFTTSIDIDCSDDEIYSRAITRDSYFNRCSANGYDTFIWGREEFTCSLNTYPSFN